MIVEGVHGSMKVGSDHSMDSCPIRTQGKSTDLIHETMERSNPWTNKQTNQQNLNFAEQSEKIFQFVSSLLCQDGEIFAKKVSQFFSRRGIIMPQSRIIYVVQMSRAHPVISMNKILSSGLSTSAYRIPTPLLEYFIKPNRAWVHNKQS